MSLQKPDTRRVGDGRKRAVLENLSPAVDGGAFPVKRVAADPVEVGVDLFADGHDRLSGELRWCADGEDWHSVPLRAGVNDRWHAAFTPPRPGRYYYTVSGWVDPFKTWAHDLGRREDPDDVALALREGQALVTAAARACRGNAARWLRERAAALVGDAPLQTRCELALDPELAERVHASGLGRALKSDYGREFCLLADDLRARFGAWYELFPRSCAPEPGRHGTFRDVAARLPYIAEMGFDVLYLPPIHPIGEKVRKGANNALQAKPGEPGVPWAIGSAAGGHKSVHPALGSLDDFHALVAAAAARGIDVALDLAFQCAPDHPYVKQHPGWFKHRPDGSIQYAENPPKKYQDIYPFDFECKDWKNLWAELNSVVDFWLDQGVRIFRVDNPHTKPYRFWAWLIDNARRRRPDVIFLAEAFTRPKVMHRLAKLGFNQSYTYFTWRNHKRELEAYLRELTTPPGREYFRPNFWPNTPDILHEQLQTGGLAMFRLRLLLAATMTANYGIYGPPFELGESTPREPGSEEYLDSEKYQLRYWDLSQPHSLAGLIGRINRVRRASPALQDNHRVRVQRIDNDQLIAYSKRSRDGADTVLTVVNLDPHWTQSGWTALDLDALGVDPARPFEVEDLLSGERYRWHGAYNFVELSPQRLPGHVLRVSQGGGPL